MSYKPLKNSDSLSELVSNINDFLIIQEKLIKYRNDQSNFLIWFTKAMQINKRACIIFINKEFETFSPEVQCYVRKYVRVKQNAEDYK